MKRGGAARVLLVCYGGFLALWLCGGLLSFALGRGFGEAELPLEAAVPANLVVLEAGGWAAENEDPQLVFEDLDANVGRVRVRAAFGREPGEMALFYTRKAGQGFSPRKTVYARPLGGGVYEYRLPPGHVHSLRIDPGNQAGNTLVIESVALNPRLSLWEYLAPGLRGLLAFAILPALATCVIFFIIEVLQMVRRNTQQKGGGRGPDDTPPEER